jgi:hypothetical protein
MAVLDTTIGQAALFIGPFVWTEGDPVSLAFRVAGLDWSGTYQAQIRDKHDAASTLRGAFTVTATYSATPGAEGTLFTLEMDQAASEAIPVGSYYTDIQQVGGVTRVWGKVAVKPQVTVQA